MANTVYVTAGITPPKDSGQSPDAGVNTFYITAGIVPDVSEGAAETNIPVIMAHRRLMGMS